ncbi:hypothetical protein M0R45_023421 [Rubus argutus]|uniref:Secreted protein n=1 Tax=Rubus argutus TaxID=59490 RepID=A0AAW1WQ78_RUBAR
MLQAWLPQSCAYKAFRVVGCIWLLICWFHNGNTVTPTVPKVVSTTKATMNSLKTLKSQQDHSDPTVEDFFQ